MIRGVMGLASKNVREIMIPRIDVVAVPTTIALNALVKVIDDAGHSRIPVYNETIDNIAGILYVKELLPFIAHKPRKFELKKMLHRPYFVPETMPLDDLLVEFKRRRLHLSCVVDEYGGFGGIITLEDIIEEIVGDIKDEFDDDEAPEIRKIGRNTYEVDSRMTLSDFNEEAGTRLPTDEPDTIGGLVFDLLARSQKNETVRFESISFKIKEIMYPVDARDRHDFGDRTMRWKAGRRPRAAVAAVRRGRHYGAGVTAEYGKTNFIFKDSRKAESASSPPETPAPFST